MTGRCRHQADELGFEHCNHCSDSAGGSELVQVGWSEDITVLVGLFDSGFVPVGIFDSGSVLVTISFSTRPG